jgi:predicted phosphatase
MKWEEVRRLYPSQYVLLEELEMHIEGDKKYIDEVAIIKAIQDPKEATRELVTAKPNTIVYHTDKENIVVQILKRPGFRGVI